MKKYILTSLILLTTQLAFADTQINGLSQEFSEGYHLSLEISGNDPHAIIIGIWPVNILSIIHKDSSSGISEEVLKTKLTDDDYKNLYKKAFTTITNFEILEKPHAMQDADHYKLTLNVNRREISIQYYSVNNIREVSADYADILEIINNYLPEDRKLRF